MRGKRRRIFSLALVFALIVQLFAGLGNAVQANSATTIAIKGLGGWSASASGSAPEQIGFAIEGTITNGDSWVNCTITSGKILRNDVAEDGWRIQTTGASSFVLVCDGYQPMANDTIKILTGTQFTVNGSSDVYEITNDWAIKYDGTTWSDLVEKGTKITMKGLGGWSASASGSTPEQIGFAIEGTITNGDSWVNCTITNGQVLRNDVTEDGWRIQTTGASSFVLVRDGYQPMANDIIKIAKGTQFTVNGTNDVYTITNDWTIKYDGSVWRDVVEKGTKVKITGLGGWSASASGSTPEQIGFAIEGTIANGDSWVNCTITDGKILLNKVEEDGWRIQTTGVSNFVLVRNEYAPKAGDVITIPGGTQFTVNGTEDVYVITNEFSVEYDGTAWANYVEKTLLTLGQLGNNSRVIAGGQGTLYQVCIQTNQTETTVDWNSGTDTTAEVYLNGETEVNATALWNTENGELFLQLDLPTDMVIDSITIKKGTQYTILGTTYEVTSDDYTVYCYDNGLHREPKAEVIPLTLGGLQNSSRVIEGGNGLIYQIRIATGQTGTMENWEDTDKTAKVFLNDTEEINGTALWCENEGELFIQLDLAKDTVVDTIAIKKGTTYKIQGTTYEVQNDYLVYHYDNDLYDTPKVIQPVSSITISERNKATDIKASGNTPEQIGIAIKETIAGGADWLDCTIIQGGIWLNNEVQSGWRIQTTGKNSFNLVCWRYQPVAEDIIKIPGGTQFSCNGKSYEIAKDYSIKYDGTSWGEFVKADVLISISGRNENTDAKALGSTPEQIGLTINETIAGVTDWIDSEIIFGKIMKNGVAQSEWKIQVTGEHSFNLVCWNYKPKTKDVISVPKGLQFVCKGKVYEVKETFGVIYHKKAWVLDDTRISCRGEELIEDALYGFRIGSTKQEIESYFAATDGIQRNLKMTFTYPQEMFDSNDKFRAGTYKVKVSTISPSGNVAEYNIIAKGYTKDAPTISYKGEAEMLADAGEKFDTSILKAVAKDGNGKKLKIKYKYSEGALNRSGELKKGEHVLYLVATDDEGQSFTRQIQLRCYEMTDVVIKGFYIQFDEELFIATNMENPKKFKKSGLILTDDVLVNGKSDIVTWITVDEHSGSLYMVLEPKKGDVLTIEGETTFLDHTHYIGIRTLNAFKGHTDGIGWIKDRLPNNGFGAKALPNRPNVPVAPATGDYNPWAMYLGICVLLLPIIASLLRKRSGRYEG